MFDLTGKTALVTGASGGIGGASFPTSQIERSKSAMANWSPVPPPAADEVTISARSCSTRSPRSPAIIESIAMSSGA